MAIRRCPDCGWEATSPSEMHEHMKEHARQQRRFVDLDPANKCEAGCGNTARLGERYCGLHIPADDADRATVSEGCKQVLLDGEHFADAVTPEAAQIITDCINFAGLPADRWPNDVNERLVRYFQ